MAANPENITIRTGESSSPAWTVYIIETQSGKLYTGITTDLQRRFDQHTTGRHGARFFKTSSPKRIVYSESASSRSAASRREAAIKRLTRKQKLELIVK